MKQIVQITRPDDLLPLMGYWRKRRQENFLTVTLNGNHEVIKVHHITKGIANGSMVHPRECFAPAFKDLAVALMFVHNHPSGNATPSKEDEEVSERLNKCAQLLGFSVLDHVIVTPESFYSSAYHRKHTALYSNNEIDLYIETLAAEKLLPEYPA